MTIKPHTKHDIFLDRDLTAAERLEPARITIRHAIQLLEQFNDTIAHAYPGLTEENLQCICDAAAAAYNAAANANGLGWSGYEPIPVATVCWTKPTKREEVPVNAQS